MGTHQSLPRDNLVNPQSFVYGDISQETVLQYSTHKFDRFILSGSITCYNTLPWYIVFKYSGDINLLLFINSFFLLVFPTVVEYCAEVVKTAMQNKLVCTVYYMYRSGCGCIVGFEIKFLMDHQTQS